MLRQALFRLSQYSRLRDLAANNELAQRMSRRFVAGETLEQAIACVAALNSRQFSATLDHLGENVSSPEDAAADVAVARTILRTIDTAGVRSNISVKLTQLGLDLDKSLAAANLRTILEEASAHQNFVRIDMESSEYVERTLGIFFELFERYRNVGVVIQSALYRSESDVEHLLQAGARVRLVKGAYLESPEVAFQRKEDVDANYLRLARLLLVGGNYPAIATHDPVIISEVRSFTRAQGIEPARFEFQMLYGVRRDLQSQLLNEGFAVRIYVPFGTSWYPYLMRRMAERPANVMFVLANVAREAAAVGS